jgi:soluble lytic murein transglycosylase-like protein
VTGPACRRGALAGALVAWLLAGAASVQAGPLHAGEALYRQARYLEAAAAFREALRTQPGDRAVWLWYGAALLRAGQPQAALAAFHRAAGPPVEAQAWLWAGAAYEQVGEEALARQAYRRALQRSPDAATAYWAGQRLRALEAAQDRQELLAALDPATYARLALRHNPRLAPSEAWRIAHALLANGRRFDVDPRLVSALVVVESGFNPRAVSPAGALGLGQLLPEVARAAGVRDPFSIEENLYGTVRVLRGHLDRYGYHRVDLALAAYNAGSGAVRRHGGVPPFSETRWYVFRVSQLYLRYLGSRP